MEQLARELAMDFARERVGRAGIDLGRIDLVRDSAAGTAPGRSGFEPREFDRVWLPRRGFEQRRRN
jgi:hypothetical protein